MSKRKKKYPPRLVGGLCLTCMKFGVGRRISTPLTKGIGRIICNKCKGEWAYNASGGYIRKRSLVSPWYHQNQLRKHIATILKDRGIKRSQVVSEVSFPRWGISQGGGLLRFDIGVPSINLLVDYHGEQHYQKGIVNNDTWKRQKANDLLKTRLVPQFGWTYIVFTYKEDVEDIEWVRKKIEKGIGKRE